jgi:hypothetical protein
MPPDCPHHPAVGGTRRPGTADRYSVFMAVEHEITSKEELPNGWVFIRCSCGDEMEIDPGTSAETPGIVAHGGVTIESLVEHRNLYLRDV